MTELTTTKINISRTVTGFLEGSHAWQCPGDNDGYGGAAVSAMAKIKAAPSRKDGSCTVALTAPERGALEEYAETMAIAAQDNVRDDPSELGELNAARALRRQLLKAGI
jgi:hypothetical protein